MKKQTILILSNDVDYLYTLRLETIEALLRQGHSVALSAPNNERVAFFEELECTFYPVEFAPRSKNPFANLKVLVNYHSLVKRLGPDLVLTYTIKSNIYGGLVCRKLNVPQIANMTGLGKALMDENLIQKMVITLLRISLKRAKTIFLQNQRDYSYFITHRISRPEQSVLIPGSGVNLDRHPLESYPKDDGTIRLIYIARIIKDKGIEEMMEAAQRVHAKYPFFSCNIVGFIGESEYEKPLEAYSQSGAGTYLGFQKDIHSLITKSHAVVLPSYHLEGIANVLLEGASTGRPVLSTDHIGCRDTFDDGVSGIMFEPRSTDALVQAIEKFIQLPYDEKVAMGLAGRKKVEREFDRKLIVEAYMKAVNTIIDEQKERGYGQ